MTISWALKWESGKNFPSCCAAEMHNLKLTPILGTNGKG